MKYLKDFPFYLKWAISCDQQNPAASRICNPPEPKHLGQGIQQSLLAVHMGTNTNWHGKFLFRQIHETFVSNCLLWETLVFYFVFMHFAGKQICSSHFEGLTCRAVTYLLFQQFVWLNSVMFESSVTCAGVDGVAWWFMWLWKLQCVNLLTNL